ncbi:MAG: RNase adapter RapZ [Pseudomonadota bacterium]
MDLILVSGRSGSGKSTALRQLEDDGYYAIDNLPATLLGELVTDADQRFSDSFQGVAVCIDARNSEAELTAIPQTLAALPEHVHSRILYLDADEDTLVRRFSETRRRHPLTDSAVSLREALIKEQALLEPLAASSTLTLDTRSMTIYELRDEIRQRLVAADSGGMVILVQSFGFKRGIPGDADLIFDLRLLPNPHWEPDLRAKTGLDPEVAAFLTQHSITDELFADISGFIQRWLPAYQSSSRSYLTVAVGCTGGQHRSVYMARRLYEYLRESGNPVQLRHRELP